jgi:hypothetical protein
MPTRARFRRVARVATGSAALTLALLGGLAVHNASPARAQDSVPPPARAEEPERVVIHLADGRRLEGPLVRRSPAEIVIRLAGFDTPFNMRDVLRVDALPPIHERYERLRAAIPDDDLEQRLLLIDWLRDRESFALALTELADLLRQAPDNERALRLKAQIEGMVKLRAESMRLRDRDSESRTPTAKAQGKAEFPVLSPDQMNLLRVYEVDLSDPPRMSVSRDTVRRLIEAYSDHELIPKTREGRAALERRPPAHILELMFRLRAREFYNEVRVEGEPKSFELFREGVHRPWLLNSCATSGCHGGEMAGNLWLKNTNPNAQSTIYTNFLILERYRLADGTPLINYDEPARSPLLHMALPRDVSLYPHPLVATGASSVWRPVIRSVDDRRFARAVEWINAMYRPRPEYPVTYEPPRPESGVPALPSDPIGER